MKVQFCSGSNILAGWDNRDSETDIRRPLPFPDGTVSHIFCEHGMEHVSPCEAWQFIEECHRILEAQGWLRIAVPDIERIWSRMTPDYMRAVRDGGHGDGSAKAALRAALCEHGHQSAWSAGMLLAVMSAIGFEAQRCHVGQSECPEMRGLEGHGKVVGQAIAALETTVIEGRKT